MDYVENLVVEKLKEIIKQFYEKDKMMMVTKQKLQEERNNSKYKKELEECKTQLSRISIDIDNIYNDKLSSILLQDDFTRIYERKKKEKLQFQNRIDILEKHLTNNINEEEIVDNLIKKFNTNFTINREIVTDLVDKIEIDENKKVYIYFKFNILNDYNMS